MQFSITKSIVASDLSFLLQPTDISHHINLTKALLNHIANEQYGVLQEKEV